MDKRYEAYCSHIIGKAAEYYRSFVLAENLSAAERMVKQYWTKQYDTSIEIKSSQEIDVFEEKIVDQEIISWYDIH